MRERRFPYMSGFLKVRAGNRAPLVSLTGKFMAKSNPFVFLQQVRSEVGKVTWPTQRETAITTVMVFVMVFLAAIFFFFADQLMSAAIGLLLGAGF